MAVPSEHSIAIVGIGCRLPGGVGDPAGARALFLAGRDVVGTVPPERFVLPATTRSGRPVPAAAALLDDVASFDAALFGISAREATAMDPQQRLLLECAWAALEDAGIRPDRLDGARAGTWVGLGLVDWARRTVWSGIPDRLDAWAGTGTFDAVAAGRIAYALGLRGPAMALHTACSASHVALHLAVRSLRSGEVDLALAGGVQLELAPEPTVLFAELGALSPTGRCRTFDAAADGYVRGEGAGLFALVRLADAVARGLRVHAVIEGSAVDHDGRTNGLTAPSARAQAEVLRAALADAGRDAGEVGFVEAHGTGTPLGDPVEVEALAEVFGRGERPLHVSSAKTVVGHLEAAAGVAGVLRAITALRARSLPPHLHLATPNPRLPVAGTRLVLGAAGAWDGGLAGVSGFGLSGTNAHLLLSAPPPRAPRPLRWPALVTLSAADEGALADRIAAVRAAPASVAVGAASGRAALRWRAAKVLAGPGDAAGGWTPVRAGRPPAVAFLGDPADPAVARLAACGVRPDGFVGRDWPDAEAARADGIDVVLPLAGLDLPAALADLFLRGADLDPGPLLDADRDEVPVYPFRRERHWLDAVPAHAPAVAADWSIAQAAVGVGGARAERTDPFGLGAAACRRWEGPVGPRATVDPACPTDVAEAALSALPDGIDEAEIDAGGRATVGQVVDAPAPLAPAALDPERPILVLGGTGHLGRAVIAALAARGARRFEVWSRRAPAAPWPPGVAVAHRAVDLAGPLPPIEGFQGAVHAAGEARVDEAAARAVRADVVAALDRALRGPGAFLVVVGSIASRWGSPGLDAYAGSHRAAEAVVARRVAAGHAGAVILAGPVADGGLVGADERAAFARAGVEAVPAARVAEVVAAATAWTGGPLGVGRIDWARLVPLAERAGRRAVFDRVRPRARAAEGRAGDLDAVLAATGAALGRDPRDLDPDAGFFALGLDSALAIQLARDLSAALGRPLPDTLVFDFPTPRALAAGLAGPAPAPAAPAGLAREPVAIVGLALRVPGADDPDALWDLLASGRDPLGPVPADRWDPADWPDAPAEGGFVDAAAFDAARFGIGPAEAAALDPQQRLLLTCAHEALERAGVAPDRLVGRRVSVHVGIGRSEYWDRVRDPEADAHVFSGTGNESSFAAGRLAHHLGTRGEAVAVNTACSSSLVALHLAVAALRAGDAELALAGGVNVLAAPEAGVVLRRMGALSPTHRCRTFDAEADGYVRSEGCVLFVLERLSDARRHGRPVWGVIEGSAVGHDGRSPGLGVPSGPAQEDVLRRALADAAVGPDELDLVAVHGTGTPLGDPIEVGALARVHAGRTRPLWLSASKSRLGHLETAAGAAALATALVAMRRGAVFPNAHLRARNPRLPDGPWALPDRVTPWPGDRPRRAGVSSFGLSGTDAHLILREGDPFPAVPDLGLRVVSGPTEAHAAAAAAAPAPTAQLWHGRSREAWRAAFWAGEPPPAPTRARAGLRVGLLCPGQGAQRPGLGRTLRAAGLGDRLDALLAPHPDLAAVLDADDPRVDDTRFTQPALVAAALVLGGWLLDLGLRPAAILGHSVGEIAAAALAGHLDPAEALAFAVARGALVGDLPPDGGMAALRAPEAAVAPLLGPGASIAAVNADDETVIAGTAAGLAAALAAAGAAGIEARPLRTSHAFHGPPMDPLLAAVGRLAPRWRPRAGSGFVSALAGTDPATGPDWGRHLRAPVAFAAALRAAPPVDVWVELGPRAVTAGLAARVLGADAVTPLRGDDPREPLLAAARLWALGAPLALPIAPPPPAPALPSPALAGRPWVALPRRAAEPLPSRVIRWVRATPGGAPAAVSTRRVASVADVLALARDLPDGCVALRADGVFEATEPEVGAVAGAFAALAAEHPDRDLRLFDGVPDDGLEAALRAGEPRVRWQDGGPRVPRWEDAAPGPALPIRGTWLVSGGDGAVGRAFCAWLRARGARVEVLSRSTGADVTDPEAVRAAVERVRARGEEIGGVVHAAGVPRGALAHLETPDGVAAAWAPKVDGARTLAAAVGDEVPIVATSSAVSWLGLEGQLAYAAANAGLEAWARGRRARGAPTFALAFGPFAAGMADAVDWAHRGARRADPARGAAVLGALPAAAVAHPGLWSEAPAPAAAAERPADALRAVLDTVAAVLGRAAGPDVGFADAGVDSLAAVEVARRLSRRFGRPLPATLLFERPTPRAVAALLAGEVAAAPAPTARPADEPVAIVGMAVRFPGAPTAEALWDLLRRGGVAIGTVPPSRWDADALFTPFPGAPGRAYVREGGFLPAPEDFDPDAFGISPREATSLDPQQRLLLELTREALEDAGHPATEAPGGRTAVFVGIADRGWLHAHRAPGAPLYPDGWAGTGNEPSFAAGRIAFTFGLRGEALALNTTCSSALVAVHHAVRALREGAADRAVAGGVAMMFLPDDTAYLCGMQALSPTHRCHVFDARADGYVRSEGAGLFVLARLSDAVARGDRVLGVIRGTAVNHDGASSGLTVPNGAAQAEVLRAALADAGVAPAEVAYLEAHGTGTRLGDPIESRAIAEVYGGGRAAPLLLGAVKANLGHTELAAGAASLAKVLLMGRHGAIPGQPDLGELNPELDLRGAEVVRSTLAWPDGPRLAAISGFGLSGTNAHLVLELPPPPPPAAPSPGLGVLAVSAPTEAAARGLAAAVARTDAAPADLGAALARRAPRRFRAAVVAADRAEARALAGAPTHDARTPPAVIWLASGQGSQVAGMGLGLDAAFPAYRAALDECARILDPRLGRPLRALLADPAAVDRTEFTQPLLFATSWATAALLRAIGAAPAVVAGHSLGELVAAAIAGVWTLPDALHLVVERGRCMAEKARPGSMAAIALPAEAVRPLLRPGAEIAAENAPEEVVIAGESDAVEATLRALPAGVRATRLPVSRPFHSACVDPMLDDWEAAVASVPAAAPTLPLVSLATGEAASDALRSPRFWRDHARNPVRCAAAAAALRRAGDAVFVDLGPTPVLSSLVRRNLGGDPGAYLATARRDGDPARTFAQAAADLWTRGVDLDLRTLHPGGPRVALPPTPFERRTFALPKPDAVAPTPAYTVEWEPVAAIGALPPRVRVVGPDRDGFAAALAGAGVAVDPQAPVTLDLRPFRGAADPATLAGLRDVAGERWLWVVSADDADPDAWALRAAARCARLERPGTRLDVVAVGGPGDLAAALAADRDEVRAIGGTVRAPRLAPLAPSGAAPIRGTWLVTGGTGALGMRFAAWLAARGAEGLVLASRTPLADDDPRRAALAALSCPVHLAAVDVSDEEAVRQLLTAHPVDAVLHAAGITAPQPLDALDPRTAAATLAGKRAGAEVLDRVLADRPLDAFVLVGSIAAVWGSRDLTAYAAANGWLEGLARRRRARGLPGQCLQFGPWGGGGMVDDARAADLARAGLALLEPRSALHTVGALLDGPVAPVVVRADWDRLGRALEGAGAPRIFDGLRSPPEPAAAPASSAASTGEPLPARILRHARAVLGYGPERVLPEGQPLADLGFDSLMATELKQRLLQEGVDLPLGRILSGPSVAEMVEMATARAAPAPHAAPDAAPADEHPDALWWWTHLAAVIVGIALASGVWALGR